MVKVGEPHLVQDATILLNILNLIVDSADYIPEKVNFQCAKKLFFNLIITAMELAPCFSVHRIEA